MKRSLAFLAGIVALSATVVPGFARTTEADVEAAARRFLAAAHGAEEEGRRSSALAGELRAREVVRDERGMWHVRLSSLHRGIAVLGSEAIVHVRDDGSLWKIADGIATGIAVETEPLVSAGEARGLVLTGCPDCARDAGAELAIFRGGSDRLVWRIAAPVADGERVWLVDAHTAEIVASSRSETAGSRFLPFGESAALGLAWAEAAGARGIPLGDRFDAPHLERDAGFTLDDDPDHWEERYTGPDARGVAANAGIARKAFALLAAGGSHHRGGAMEGIGLEAASRIWAEAADHYLLSADGFLRAREATIDAATALFGNGSREQIATATAWDLVGVAPHADPPCQVVTNGGFEGSASPWTLSGAAVRGTGGSDAASGTGYLALGGSVNSTGSASQEIYLPSGVALGVSFKLRVLSDEELGEGATATDLLTVGVQVGATTTPLATFSNLHEGATWVARGPVALTGTGLVRLVFRATNDAQRATTFRVDDVSIDCAAANLRPDFHLTATSSHATRNVNENVTFTFTALNEGTLVGRAATVEATLPPFVSFVSCTSSVGTCVSPAAGTVRASLGDVLPTRSATITVVGHLDCGIPDGVAVGVVATASAETSDSDPGDDSATASTTPYNPVYAEPVADSNSAVCNRGTLQLTVPAVAGATYAWSGPDGFSSTLREPTISNVSSVHGGTYSVVVTFNGCASPAGSEFVTIADDPPAFITPEGATTFCGTGSVKLTANGTGAEEPDPEDPVVPTETFLWSTGETTQSIIATEPGSYTVTVTDLAGCSATSEPVVVTSLPLPGTAISASGPLSFCAGGSVTLTASPGEFYQWSTGAAEQSITVTESGTYSVVVTSADGCTASSEEVTVTVNPLPSASITASGPLNFCEGGSVTLSAPDIAGASYLWSNGATTRSITVTESGDFSVTVTTDAGCARTSITRRVNVSPNATASITADGPLQFCEGGSVTLTASDGATWAWSNGATTRSIQVTESGSYSVVVTNSGGCAATSDAVDVTVTPVPTPTVTAGGPTTFCEGGSVTLTASPGASYLWSNGETTQAIVATSPGSYHVTVSYPSGCSARSDETLVSVIPGPAVTITTDGPTTFCEGGSVTLFANGGSEYTWSTGATVPSIVVSESGTYSVSSTVGECTSTASITVNVTGPPTVGLSFSPAVEGSAIVMTATVSNSDAGSTRRAVVDWGDGSAPQSLVVPLGGVLTLPHVYGDDGAYPVQVVVNDPTCAPVTVSGLAVVENLDPLLALDTGSIAAFASGAAFVGRKGASFTGFADATDAGSDDLTFSWTMSDGGSSSFTYFNNGSSADPSPSPMGVYPFEASDEVAFDLSEVSVREVAVEVRDDDGGSAGAAAALLVTGAASCRETTIVWEHEMRGQGATTWDAATLERYLTVLGRASAVFGEAVAAGTPAEARAVLQGRNRRGRDAFLAELLAAWLNFSSGSLRWWSPVEGPRNFLSVVNEIEAMFLAGAGNAELEAAASRLAHINDAGCRGVGPREEELAPEGRRRPRNPRRSGRD